jgi:hypothetical protein
MKSEVLPGDVYRPGVWKKKIGDDRMNSKFFLTLNYKKNFKEGVYVKKKSCKGFDD